MSARLAARLQSPGPKRILAIDGEGVRGMIAVALLERIEQLLRERHGNPALRLCNYFDLIGGTSAGAIIAGGLATGMSMATVREVALQFTSRVFSRPRWRKWWSLFAPEPLQRELTS